jgi:hypothetical protein
MISYKSKYEKYKLKYLELKKIIGGVPPKPKSTDFQKTLINVQCFNKKFFEKYGEKLSLISIINKYEPNYELWDQFIEDTFNYIKEKLILTDEQIIKLLNNYFDIIKKRIDEVSSENPNIKILIDTIIQIVDEVIEFIKIHGEDEFYSILNSITNFGKKSLEDKYLEIQKEKIPTVASGSEELYHEIDELVKKLVSQPIKMKEENSILNFTIPLNEFTYDKQNTLKNSTVTFASKMPKDLQSALLSLPDKDVYKMLEIVILKGFLLNINVLQSCKGMGAHVIHFLRVKNNLALTKGIEKVKLSMPIYVQVMEVGLVKEFLSRIKHLITYNFEILLKITNDTNRKKGKPFLTDKKLREENLIKKRNHIKVIMDLYKHLHNEDLWNFVIILYTINIRTNPELYNDIGLIISFLMVNYPLENIADKAQRIELCQEKLVQHLNYKPKH